MPDDRSTLNGTRYTWQGGLNPAAARRMTAALPHMVPMKACVRDPYYHLSKDRTFVTYPDAQDTADRLRAIRAVCEPLKKIKTSWPLTSYNQPAATQSCGSYGGPRAWPCASSTPGTVFGSDVTLCQARAASISPAWSSPIAANNFDTYQIPGQVLRRSTPQLAMDDPRRSALFWSGGRCSTASRFARAAVADVRAVTYSSIDRVHSDAWHT
jgi:hypothetical protein